jgi:SAM-dependent methyltransferase
LSVYKDCSVADIGCGYGRFANHFNNYIGVDFSDEMLKLAQEQNPTKNFIKGRVLEPLPAKYDIIFENNCCHSFQVCREDFINYYKQFANVAVITIERNGVLMEWVYPKTDNQLNLK